MTKTKSTKRALLLSALSLLMCVSMLIGSTFAWFTDSATSGNNKIVAGTLDVDLLMADVTGNYTSIAGENAAIFGEGSLAQNNAQETLWEPGKTQIVYLAVANKGSLDLKYNIALNVVDGGLIGSLEYAIVDGAQYGALDAYPDWAALKANAQNGDVVAGTTVAAPNGAIKANEAMEYFALAVHMKEEAGNQYQGKDITIDITVLATQLASESDSFGNKYDKDAEFPAVETVIARGESNNISWTLTDAGTLAISGDSAVTAADIQSLSANASQITNVKIGSYITEIGEEAFKGLNISAVTFEDNSKLQKIGTNAFRDCVALETIEIPASVETISEKAFQGCASLETLTFDANSQLKTVGTGKNAFANCTSLKSVVLPDSVETIGVACFYGCTSLETVVLGDNVSSIGASAFENSGVTAFEVPAALTVIPNNMLKNTKITTITVGDQVTTVNPGAFENCTELKTAYIGSATIKESVFAGCSNLETVIFANVTKLDGWAFMNCTNLKTVVINAENNLTLGYNTYTTGAKANWYGNTYYSATGNVITYIASAIDGAYSEQCENCLLGHGWNDGTADGTDILAYTNGGTFANGTTFVDGTLATPTKAGYVFGGWYAESDFSGTAVTTAAAGQIYYAKWIAE